MRGITFSHFQFPVCTIVECLLCKAQDEVRLGEAVVSLHHSSHADIVPRPIRDTSGV